MNKPPPIPRNTLENWTILVIDDENDGVEVASRILRFYGAQVHTATNGREALALVSTHKFRLIISDLSMPIMDGWQFIEVIKKNRATTDTPVIALTAHAMPGDRERAMAAGFYNHLTKPLTPATFMSDLLRLLITLPDFEMPNNNKSSSETK